MTEVAIAKNHNTFLRDDVERLEKQACADLHRCALVVYANAGSMLPERTSWHHSKKQSLKAKPQLRRSLQFHSAAYVCFDSVYIDRNWPTRPQALTNS